MSLPLPVTSKSYSEHNSRIHTISNEMCLESYRTATAQLHRWQGAEPTDVVDVNVTCDGNWWKRVFTAPYGVVVVASFETGQVLDAIVLSYVCNQKEASMDIRYQPCPTLCYYSKYCFYIARRSTWIGTRSTRTPAMPILMAHHLPWKPKGLHCSGHALFRGTASATQK